MATHSSMVVWEIPWTEEAGGLHSIVSQTVGDDFERACTHTRAHTHTHTIRWETSEASIHAPCIIKSFPSGWWEGELFAVCMGSYDCWSPHLLSSPQNPQSSTQSETHLLQSMLLSVRLSSSNAPSHESQPPQPPWTSVSISSTQWVWHSLWVLLAGLQPEHHPLSIQQVWTLTSLSLLFSFSGASHPCKSASQRPSFLSRIYCVRFSSGLWWENDFHDSNPLWADTEVPYSVIYICFSGAQTLAIFMGTLGLGSYTMWYCGKSGPHEHTALASGTHSLCFSPQNYCQADGKFCRASPCQLVIFFTVPVCLFFYYPCFFD